jgi:hypothetical protein
MAYLPQQLAHRCTFGSTSITSTVLCRTAPCQAAARAHRQRVSFLNYRQPLARYPAAGPPEHRRTIILPRPQVAIGYNDGGHFRGSRAARRSLVLALGLGISLSSNTWPTACQEARALSQPFDSRNVAGRVNRQPLVSVDKILLVVCSAVATIRHLPEQRHTLQRLASLGQR